MNQLAAAEDKSAAKPDRLEDQLSFKSRYVLVFGEIDDKLALATCRRLLALSEDSDAPITMLISSPGGHVESGDAIHDMINFVRAPVTTVGTGWVASAGAHIFLAPPKERRVCLPNTRFMIHQPAGGELQPYRPQRRALNLLACGERYAIASWGGWSAEGAWVWRWKDRIDRGFIERFKVTPLAAN